MSIGAAILVGVLAVLLIYEGYALWTPTSGDTISELVWTTTVRYPIIAFLAGLLCGHFFWQRAG